VFCLQRQPQFFENMTSVARRRKHFWGFLASFCVAERKYFDVLLLEILDPQTGFIRVGAKSGQNI